MSGTKKTKGSKSEKAAAKSTGASSTETSAAANDAARQAALRKLTETKPANPAASAGARSRPKAKDSKKSKPAKPAGPKRVSALDAAAKVLSGASRPMSAGDLIEQMKAKKLWSSPGGMTPDATLSAAIGREIKDKGKESRFKKVDRGLFAAGPGKAG